MNKQIMVCGIYIQCNVEQKRNDVHEPTMFISLEDAVLRERNLTQRLYITQFLKAGTFIGQKTRQDTMQIILLLNAAQRMEE